MSLLPFLSPTRPPSPALSRLAASLVAAACVACGGDDGGSSPGPAGQGGVAGSAGSASGAAGKGGAPAGQGGAGASVGGQTNAGGANAGATSAGGQAAGTSGQGGTAAAGQGGAMAAGQGGAAAGGQAGGAVGGQAGAPAGGQGGATVGGQGGAAGGQGGAAVGGQAGQGGSAAGGAGAPAGGQGGSAAAGGQGGSAAGAGGAGAGAGGAAGGAAAGSGGQPPPLGSDACNGYATRYWDCCKAHCSWPGNVPQGVAPVAVCNAKDEPISGANAANTPSSCDGPGPGSAYTCQSMAPWKVSETLSYGYAAVPATGDICGRCYQIEFTGTSHNAGNDPGSAALKGKTMIVQATNIGYDVGNGQFDVLIPGGGVGAFNACSYQWGQNDLGAQYGGFLLQCKQQNPGAGHEATKACVKAKCDSVFGDPSMAELKDACAWFTGWYEAADNPNLRYAEVPCPDAIVQVSGSDRRPLNDIKACGAQGNPCTPEQQANCDCGWTNGGTTCGTDDGSCCWKACCGPK